MTDLKRDEIKYIRDLSKSSYKKDTECYICGKTDELQFHHFYSLTELWNKFKQKAKFNIESVEDILEWREAFKSAHHIQIYEETVTLCKYHHMDRLHKIYGKSPSLSTAPKQKRWCDIRREKEYGLAKKLTI